jgi:hypothetical protein
MNLKTSFFVSVVMIFLTMTVFTPPTQAADCGTGPGGLCYGISNTVQCSTSILADCNSYPMCSYSGTISGYFCKNKCFNTGQQGSCGLGSVCLCLNQAACGSCTYHGKDLAACNDSGCVSTDTTPPKAPTNVRVL